MTRQVRILDKTYPIEAHERILKALGTLSSAIADLESQLYDALYDEAFEEGKRWFKDQVDQVSGRNQLLPEPFVNPQKLGLSEVEKITDQSVHDFILHNPGWRSSDIINKTLELPVKPALTENNIKSTINRLRKENRIANKSGRWYSTQVKTNGQQYQVMTYLPDGSKYLGTDVIKENA